MKRCMFAGLLAAGLVLSCVARAEDDNEDCDSIDEKMDKIELEKQWIDVEAKRSELTFQNEMRKIEVQKKQIELQRMSKMLEFNPGQPGLDGQPGCSMMRGPHLGEAGEGCCPMERHGKGKAAHCAAFLIICAIIHVLLTAWVYQDGRKRNTGVGLWMVLTLMTGFLAAIVYALVRIGDNKQSA